ncbi:MAG: FAD binding domain-containing protein [Deltaproteobacteria bacterium]|nr:FAD binding domain-containing protein [Deltaproteobacteria bacterium]
MSSAYIRPRSLAEALDAKAQHPDWMVLAGGTDLMVNATHRPEPAGILDLWRLPELRGVTMTDVLTIGAGTTWLEVEHHAAVLERFGPLAAAAREIGALQIQARGTLGGNVGTSSPVGDSLPVLLAFDAELELASAARGRRRIPYREFCTGYRKTQLAADELIVAAHLRPPATRTRTTWRKVGTRRAQSISKVMGAAFIELDGDVVTRARVALGAVADRPIRIAAVEQAVTGLALGAKAAEAARAALRSAIKPIDDVRSTATYRRDVAENLVARFFS